MGGKSGGEIALPRRPGTDLPPVLPVRAPPDLVFVFSRIAALVVMRLG
jgi:hypothetical protein